MSDKRQENKALVRRIYEEMWNQAQPALARELFTHPGGVERAVSNFLAAFPDLQHTVIEMIAEDDRVAARFVARGTHAGQWEHFPPTGRAIEYTGVTIAQITAGKISDHYTWWDRASLIEQVSQQSD